jgi:hypothetical protein
MTSNDITQDLSKYAWVSISQFVCTNICIYIYMSCAHDQHRNTTHILGVQLGKSTTLSVYCFENHFGDFWGILQQCKQGDLCRHRLQHYENRIGNLPKSVPSGAQEWKNIGYKSLICTGWWYTYPSEKWWTSSVGIMKFPVYGKIKKCYKPPTSNPQPPRLVEHIFWWQLPMANIEKNYMLILKTKICGPLALTWIDPYEYRGNHQFSHGTSQGFSDDAALEASPNPSEGCLSSHFRLFMPIVSNDAIKPPRCTPDP